MQSMTTVVQITQGDTAIEYKKEKVSDEDKRDSLPERGERRSLRGAASLGNSVAQQDVLGAKGNLSFPAVL